MKIFRLILSIIAVIVFWFGAYFMGNLVLDTFSKPFFWDGFMSTLYGIVCWLMVGVIIFISGVIKVGVYSLTKQSTTSDPADSL